MGINRLRQLWEKGKSAIGIWLRLGCAQAVEYLAREDFDFLVIDHEHGPFGEDSVISQLRAMAGTPVTPLVRVGHNTPQLIKRVLDSGALGVIVPHIDSVEEARRVVAEAKYAPLGLRSLGGKRWSIYGDDFYQRANDEVLSIILIESAAGVKDIHKILSVPGVDACLVGPCDLGSSMGLAPDIECRDPRLAEAVNKILAAGIELSIPVGIHCTGPEVAKRRIAQGFRFVSIGNDDDFLVAAAKESIAAIRKLL